MGWLDHLKEKLSKEDLKQAITVGSPLKGELIALKDVPDPVFSEGVMGKGIAIAPSEGLVVAPFKGKISAIFPTGHSVGITSHDGVDVLVHIGMDTVELEGEGFEILTTAGAHVQKGDVLIKFDIDLIKAKGYSLITPVVITNTADYEKIAILPKKKAERLEEIMTIS